MLTKLKSFYNRWYFSENVKTFKNYKSNQAIKLLEINSRYNLFKPGNKVIDLGSFPGGWSQVATQRTNSTMENPLVYSVDFQEMEPVPGSIFIQGDIMDQQLRADLVNKLDMRPVDIILCDLDFERDKDQDRNCLQMINLNKQAVNISLKLLKPGGTLLMKTLSGAFEPSLKKTLGFLFMDFQVVSTMTLGIPDDLYEIYYLGQGFKLTDSYTKYKIFYEKFFANKMDQIHDEELPPEILSQEEMIQQILEFLRDAEEKQFLVERKIFNEIKQHPAFSDMDWSKLNLNISEQSLSPEQLNEIFLMNTRGKFTSNPVKYESLEQVEAVMAEYSRKSKELKRYKNKRDMMLLDDEEILGNNELPYELEQFAQEIKANDSQLKSEETDEHKVKMGKLLFEEHFFGMEEHEVIKKLESDTASLEQFKKDHINDVLRTIGVEREIRSSDKLTEELLRKTMKSSERRTKEYRNQYYQKDAPYGKKIKQK